MARTKSRGSLEVDPYELSFPIRDGVRLPESGQGYALRMASENHLMGLQQIKRWLGRSQFSVLDAEDAHHLHRWFGADVEQLRLALGRVSTGHGERGYEYAGQSLGRSYFINRSYPRVCPACIEERRICRLAWDISLAVACDRHKRLLTDRCDYCWKPLSWNRSAVDTCTCGENLSHHQSPANATQLEVQFAGWLAKTVASSEGDADQLPERPLDSPALMNLLWPLSLDGGLHIIYALGTAASYEDNLGDPQCEKAPRIGAPLTKARHMLWRAGALAERIARLEPVKLRVSRPSVVVRLLAEAASAQGSTQDQSLAHSILLNVMHQSSSTWRGAYPQLSQMRLF